MLKIGTSLRALKKLMLDTIVISINVFELYRILENAIENYLDELKKDENEALRDNFIKAWSSIEEYLREIAKNSEYQDDAKALLDYLGSSSDALLLEDLNKVVNTCLLYTSPSPRDGLLSRMPSSA